MSGRRRIRWARGAGLVTAVVSVVAGLAVGTAPSTSAAPQKQVYVALGDSFSAAPLVFPQAELLTCARSSVNYPALLAKDLKVDVFRDATCSSATTHEFAQPQPGNVSGVAAPQYSALTKDTTLVTVGIGGNDIGLVGLAYSCINLLPSNGLLSLPLLGESCKATSTAGGVDQYARSIDAFAPTYGKVIGEIRKRSPHAKILLVGYPTAVQPGGCWPFLPILPQDADYLQAVLDRLNLRMAQQARQHGATYVDLRTPSIGHDACQGIGVKWVEGVVPALLTNGLMPLHPNAAGMTNAVPVIKKALR